MLGIGLELWLLDDELLWLEELLELLELLELDDCELLELEDGIEGELLALWLLDWQATRPTLTTATAINLLIGLIGNCFSSMDSIGCIPVIDLRPFSHLSILNST